MAGCADCRGESEYLSVIWERLDRIPVEAPGPRLRARFYEALDAYRWGHEEARVKKPPVAMPVRGRWRAVAGWQMAAAAAVAFVMIFSAGWFGGRSLDIRKEAGDKQTSNQQIGQLRAEVDHMRQLVALSLLQQQSATDRLETPSEIQKAKREIARIRTIQRQRDLVKLEGLAPEQLASRIASLEAKSELPGKRTTHRQMTRLKAWHAAKTAPAKTAAAKGTK